MLIVVAGGNGSGKSDFAEKCILEFGDRKRYYIATMIPYGDEGVQRVERHRAVRADSNYDTIEEPYSLAGLDFGAEAVVLVEDVANLVANKIFGRDSGHGHDSGCLEGDRAFAGRIADEVAKLAKRSLEVVAVTITGLSVQGYDGETKRYIEILNEVNLRLFDLADRVFEMKDRKSIKIK